MSDPTQDESEPLVVSSGGHMALRPVLRDDWASVSAGGMRREISATIAGLGYILVTVLADEQDESLWVELDTGGHVVQIPLAVLRDTLNSCDGVVHSERWFDENHPAGADE